MKSKKCKKKLKTGKKCKHTRRLKGFCTIHYIKSRNYKGKNKNIRRKKVTKRKKKKIR